MTRIRAFQILVISSALLYLAWMLLPHAPRVFSTEVQNILSWGGYGGAPWVNDPRFYLSIGAGKLIASAGLFLFLSWGRWLLLLTDGAILALAFTSPISEAMHKDA